VESILGIHGGKLARSTVWREPGGDRKPGGGVSWGMRPTLPPCLVALIFLAAPARAQVVRGVVAEEVSSAPVEGAMVILQDLDGAVVRRVLTDASGAFIARMDHPGVYLIRVDRIGYESLTTSRFDVPIEGTFQRVAVPIRPVELTGLDVEAAAWTMSSGAFRYTLLQYERTLEADRRTVREEARRFIRSTGQAPYVSAPVEELVTEGFIRENPDRTMTYYAPDAEAFLADPFLDTHCMRIEEVKDGRVGLAFEPVRGRRVPDIKGILWIDAATAALERLEFSYVNLPPDRDAGVPGGQVLFGRLPSGNWIVRDWAIRMPMLVTNPQRTRIVVSGYLEEGGRVWRVIDRSGAYLMEATTASVSGTVTDSTGTRPLPGAVVDVADGGVSATTQGAGTFLLPGLAAGLQHVVVHHPSLDTLGLGPVSEEVDAAAGEITEVKIRVPGAGELAARACATGPESDRETAILLGRVQTQAGPAEGVRVRLRWLGGTREGFAATARAAPTRDDMPPLSWATDPEDDAWLFTTLDVRGIFLLCGVPTGSQVRVQVEVDEGAPSVHTATLPYGSRVVTLPIFLRERREP